MNKVRSFPNTTGYYVYAHITPNEMFYIGMSKMDTMKRWKPSAYKTKTLYPYIEQYGWENIRHVVLKDGLTREQALVLECLLIDEAKRQGFCINKYRSGHIEIDNPNEYQRIREQTNPKRREYMKKYLAEHKEQKREYDKQRRLKKLSDNVS